MIGCISFTADDFAFRLQQFDMLHYAGMSIFKIGIILLNLVPYIALHITRPRNKVDT